MSVVIVTGAAGGIGRATVEKYLVSTEFSVVAIDRNRAAMEELESSICPEQRHRLHSLALDLCDEAAVQSALLGQISRLGSVEHLVVSHAVAIENEIHESDKWDLILNVNLRATQRLLALLDQHLSDGGRVVLLSSVLGRAGKKVNTGYVSSKHALLGLVKALALDWAPRKITVNAVLPCWVDTPMLRTELKPQAALVGVSVDRMIRQIRKRIPLRSLVKAEDVANTIMFLTSPAAALITAQSIVIDGGYGCGV